MNRLFHLLIFIFSLSTVVLGQNNRAIKFYNKANSYFITYPKSNGNRLNLIKSLELVNKALQIERNYKKALLLKSNLLLYLDSCDKALIYINNLINIDNTFAVAYERRGYIKDKCFDDILGSLSDSNIAINLNPRLSKSYIGRANNRLRLVGDNILPSNDSIFHLILKDYEKAIELKPNSIMALSNRASFNLEILKDTTSACSDWYKLYELGWDVDYELYNYCNWNGQ